MSEHTHDDPDRLTVGCAACIERAKPIRALELGPANTADRRRTATNNLLIERGIHPATHRALLAGHRCGTCSHHQTAGNGSKTFHKCELHRLGTSHSAASDIRVSWPACDLYQPETQSITEDT